MSSNDDIEKSVWWMLKKLKEDSLTYVSDKFIVDVTEPEDDYTATQQRKLLARFKADGLINYGPHRGQIETMLISVKQPTKYFDADKFVVTLLAPTFDEAFDEYHNKYGTIIVRLIKDVTELYVEVDTRRHLLHNFKAASMPDILFDYLLDKRPNQEVSKKQLDDEGIINDSSQPLSVITSKAGFKGKLAKYFLPTNEKNRILIRTELMLGVDEATKLEDDLTLLTH